MERTEAKKRVFIDMDGVLAKWCSTATIEEVMSAGYFISRELQYVMKLVIDILSQKDNLDIYILSAVYIDDHSEIEKRQWLRDKSINIPEKNWIFVPYGQSKSRYIRDKIGLRETDVLIDDYSVNLREWHGIGVKFLNGINGTKGTWNDRCKVSHTMAAEEIADKIIAAA